MSWEKCAYRKKEVREQTENLSAMVLRSDLIHTQKGGFSMRGRKLWAVWGGVAVLLVGAIGVFTALATPPSGNAEADFNFVAPGTTTVGPTDPDILAPLTAFDSVAPVPIERFVDFDASGNYTPGEPIYSQAVAGPVAAGNTRLTSFNGFPAGSVVALGDPDVGLVTTAFPPTDMYVDQDASGNYTPGEPIYRDVDSSGNVSAGDLRLLFITPTYVNPGDFAVLSDIIVTDGAGGTINAPLNVDRVCVAKTDGSTVRDSDLLELRLYRENNKAPGFQGFGPNGDDLLDIVPNPDLTVAAGDEICANGVQFGDIGVLLFSVPNTTQRLYIVGTFSPAAQRGDHLQLIVKMFAADDLLGGGTSSAFINGAGDGSLTKTSPNVTIIGGPALGDVFVIDETASLVGSAAPGTKIVLQQFSIENRTNNLVPIERITAFADGFRNGQPNDSVLAGITRVRLFRESGSTGPGWQEGDELLGTVTRPDLVSGARFGGNRRTLITIQPNSVQRFYIVVDLAAGMNDGDVIQGAVEVSASSGAMPAPPKITVAGGSWEIEAPAATIGFSPTPALLSSKTKVKVTVQNVPSPGLDVISGVISFDPDIIQVVATAQGPYRVRGLGNYLVEDVIVDNNGGTIEFLVSLKPGRRPLTGSGDIMEIEFESAPNVNPGDESPLDIEIDQALDTNGNDLIFDPVSGIARIRIIMGDVDGDGVVTRRDARLLARWILGRAVLTAIQKKAADVDHSCPASTNWETLAPGDCVNETDVRWIREAAAGLRTLSSSANLQTLSRGLTVLALPSGGVEFRALNAERMGVQVFALSGSLVFSAETTTGVLRFEGISNRGSRLARGVYLYIVTLYGRDGSVWRSEVRKFIVR